MPVSDLSLSFHLYEPFSNADQIPVWIHDGKFPHPPRLVFEGVLARDSFSRELDRSKSLINALNVRHPDVAARMGFRRSELSVREEVKLDGAAAKNGVIPEGMNLTVKSEPPIKDQRVAQRTTGQNRDGEVVGIGCVQCMETSEKRVLTFSPFQS